MFTTSKDMYVFISSTYHDTHAERRCLIKRVFPAPHEKLLCTHVHFGAVDL